MWPFRRNKTEGAEELPPEVKEFYQEEPKDRTSIAWLLAVVSLLVTVSVALGLFFGGRLIYRNIREKKPDTTTASATNTEATENVVLDDTSKSPNTPSVTQTSPTNGTVDSGAATTTTPSATTTPTPVVTPTPAPITPTTPVATTPAPATTPQPAATTPAPAKTPATSTPAVASASTKITNTGPGDTLALFVEVSLLAAVLHSIATRRRISGF